MYVYRRMFVFYVCCSESVGVCGNVCCVAGVVKYSVYSLRVLNYGVCLCKGCDRCCCVFCRCSCIGSVSVLSFICALCVSCGSSQCCIRHDLQFVNAGRACKR